MVIAKKWVMRMRFDGMPKLADFELQEEELPTLSDGGVLFKASYLSVDPYMRIILGAEGDTMMGEQLATVVESKHPDYTVGSMYLGDFGWRSHTIKNLKSGQDQSIKGLPELGKHPVSMALGDLGMTGATAYLGLKLVAKPLAGQTLLVNSAAGAVGNVVGQIALNMGCRVIGYTGSDDKVAWLKQLGFHEAFNYNTCNVNETLKKAAPDGVDVYFDHVGGSFSSSVIQNHMRKHGRVVVVGYISQYNQLPHEVGQGPHLYGTILFKGLHIQGFTVFEHPNELWKEAHQHILNLIDSGKMKSREHVCEGFESMPQAFIGQLNGENTGKAIVKA